MTGFEIEWDDDNETHTARHDVVPREVEEALADPRRLPFGVFEGRRGFVGATSAGRLLFVVVEEGRRGLWRCVTARDATAAEKRRYRRRGK